MARPEARARANVTIRADLAAWLDDEAERRVCNRRLLVDQAVELLRRAIAEAPDLVDLPPPPRGAYVVSDGSGGTALHGGGS